MPRKTRMARLLRTLGREQELRQLVELLVAEVELRHHGVAELRRISDVARQLLLRLATGPFVAQIRRALIRAAGAEVRVARGAARAREDLGTGDRLLV